MKRADGYIAITTAIILSAVMLLISASTIYVALTSRLGTSTASLKAIVNGASQGCLDQALLQLSLDSTYAGSESLTLQSGSQTVTCSIMAITASGSNKIIKAHATISALGAQGPVTNLILTVHATQLTAVSLQEVPHF